MPTREQLPQDKVTLQDMVLELLTTIQRSRLNEDELRHRIAMLLRRIYGPRTERFDPNQGSLFDEAADGQDQPAPAEPPPTEPASRAKRKARPHGRRPLPKDLPRHPKHHTLTDAERLCSCGCLRIDIGADRSEQLDWQPASYFVWEHWIHKYLCPGCTGGKRAAADTPATVATSTEATTSMDKANNTENNSRQRRKSRAIKRRHPASADAATANETVTTAATQAAVNATSVPPTESLRIVPGPQAGLRDHLGAHAGHADRQRIARAGPLGPRHCQQVLRSSTAVSPDQHLDAARSAFAPLDHLRLDGGVR